MFWQNVGLALLLAAVAARSRSALSLVSLTAPSPAFSVPPLIATLSDVGAYRGLAEGISRPARCARLSRTGSTLGQGEVSGAPTILSAGIIAAVTRLYPLGPHGLRHRSNEIASRFSGPSSSRRN